MRRILPESVLEEVGKLDPAAIAQVRDEAWPDVRDPDELHDVLHSLIAFPETTWGQPPRRRGQPRLTQLNRQRQAWASPPPCNLMTQAVELRSTGQPGAAVPTWLAAREWQGYFDRLRLARRATRAEHDGATYWVAAERARTFSLLFPGARFDLPVRDSMRLCSAATMPCWPWSPAGCRISVPLRLLNWETCSDFRALKLKKHCCAWKPAARCCEDNSRKPRGRVARAHPARTEHEWCERRLLARIHRLTVATLRKQIEPVTAAQFMRWLLRWQHIAPGTPGPGRTRHPRCAAPVAGLRDSCQCLGTAHPGSPYSNYDPKWLDQLCLTGAVGWGRLSPHPATLDDTAPGKRRVIPTSVAPITFFRARRGRLDDSPPLPPPTNPRPAEA